MSGKNIVLLTATITPPQGAKNLSRTDPKQRIQDYKKSIAFYVSSINSGLIDAIVFVDNSASDISELLASVPESMRHKVEFISFYGLNYDPNFGRGFGEFKLVDHAMANSSFLSSLDEDDVVWKITGRYIIRNIEEIIQAKPKNFDVYCNCKNHPSRWIDLHTIAWRRDGYKNFIEGIYQKIGESSNVSAEVIFRNLIDTCTSTIKIRKRFNRVCMIEGVRGFDGARYEDSKWKINLRRACLVFFPWLWI